MSRAGPLSDERRRAHYLAGRPRLTPAQRRRLLHKAHRAAGLPEKRRRRATDLAARFERARSALLRNAITYTGPSKLRPPSPRETDE